MKRFAKLTLVSLILVTGFALLRGTAPQVATGTWQNGPDMTEARTGAAAVTLDDGRVLVFGGTTSSGGATNAVQVFSDGSWSDLGVVMLDARSAHSATAMADGRILLAGGENSSGPLSSLEIYDPVSGSFSSAGTLSGPRTAFGAARLPDGRVLMIGGSDGADPSSPLASSEIYDSESGSASAGPSLGAPRSGLSVTRLLDGKILIAGGNNGEADLASTVIYDPADGSFTAGADLSAPRSGHTAILLPHNNSVLIAGGSSAGSDLSSAELYIPWTASLSATGAMSAARSGAAGSGAGFNGIALVAGGSRSQSSELYGFATVKTDKRDYAPGEIVTITGSGWEPSETVTMVLHENANIHSDLTLTAVADASGNIVNQEYSPEEHDIGVRYYLTASGAGSQAQTTFTDGNIRVRSAPATVTFSLTATRYNSSTNCTGTAQPSTTVTVGSTAAEQFLDNVANTESIKFQAAASSVQGGAFVNWTSSSAFTILDAPTNRTICVQGFSGGGNRDYFANYQPNLSIDDVGNINENAGNAVFTVTLSAASTQTITVDFTTVDGTAAAPGDYTTTSGTLTYTPGQTSKTISVPIINDSLDENNEDFTVHLSNPANAGIADADGSATIVDNDPAPTLSINDVSMDEGDSGTTSFIFTVSLSAVSGKDVTVNYSTTDGTATTANSDYQSITNGSLTIPAGSPSGTITVLVNGDTDFEPDETFSVLLSGPTNASILDGTGVGTIQNDDASNAAPAVAANNASVTVDEGATAANTGTYSDANAGDNVSITASVGSVIKTGTNSGTWSWSFATTDGPDDSQTVTITADDGNGGVTTTTFSLTVNNVAPTVAFTGGPTTVDESGVTERTYSYSISDPGDDTVQSVTTSCGTGGEKVAGSDSNNDTSGSFKCKFPDGPATPTVTASATDSDNATGNTAERAVTVNNVAPTVEFTSGPTTVDESGVTEHTYSYSISDPGDDTVQSVSTSCGTGGVKVGGSDSNNDTSGSFKCKFPDGPASPTVTASATDSDGDTGNTAERAVTVNNVAPTVEFTSGPTTVDESGVTERTYSYSISDPGDDTVQSVTTSCGTGGEKVAGSDSNNNTSGSFKCTFPDGPATPTVTASATDSDGDTGNTAMRAVTVSNVAPTINNFAISGGSGVACTAGNSVTVSFSVFDPADNSHDPITGLITWGDGNTTPISGRNISETHSYSAGTYSLTVSVNDGDGGMDTDGGTNNISLLYNTSGILQPINADGSSVFKIGSTVPTKTRITDCNGNPVGTLGPKVMLAKLYNGQVSDQVNEVSSSAADSGNTMRYDSSGTQYIYNLSTKRSVFAAGGDLTEGMYRLWISDPTIATIQVDVKLRK